MVKAQPLKSQAPRIHVAEIYLAMVLLAFLCFL